MFYKSLELGFAGSCRTYIYDELKTKIAFSRNSAAKLLYYFFYKSCFEELSCLIVKPVDAFY